jgi:hypothetical protein
MKRLPSSNGTSRSTFPDALKASPAEPLKPYEPGDVETQQAEGLATSP